MNINLQPLNNKYADEFANIFAYYFIKELKNDLVIYDEEFVKERLIKPFIFEQYKNKIINIDIALIENKIKGFIVYQIDSRKSDWNEREGHGFIREFYVDKDFRRQGIGTQLLKNAENKLKEMGAENIYLTSSDKYYVQDFYFKNGYMNENKASPQNNNEYFSKELE